MHINACCECAWPIFCLSKVQAISANINTENLWLLFAPPVCACRIFHVDNYITDLACTGSCLAEVVLAVVVRPGMGIHVYKTYHYGVSLMRASLWKSKLVKYLSCMHAYVD